MINNNNFKYINKKLLINYLNKRYRLRNKMRMTVLEKQLLRLKSKIEIFKLIIKSFDISLGENNSRILHNILSNKT